jgi:hypothetical protein
MTKRFCERCQKMLPERGLHPCVKASPNAPVKNATPVTTHRGKSITTGVTTAERKHVVDAGRGDKVRVYRWRDANRERYNAYMRKWRAERAAKAAKAI